MPSSGIEPATLRALARRFNQLSYAAKLLFVVRFDVISKERSFVADVQ